MSAAVHLHILAALMVGSAHLAGAAAWTGYVFDGESRLPLEDALVRAASGRSATTDAQGRYLIQDPPTSVDGPSIAGWDRAGGSLFLELPHREALRLEVLDLSGRLLSRPFDGDAGPGRWSWSVSSLGAMTDPVVVRLVHAGSRHTWTILPGMGIGARTETQGGIPARSAGTESDTFRISLAGYDSALVLAEAASSTVDTTWLSPRTAPGGIPWNATIAYGTLLDTRDKQTYRTVRIGSQNWMAQNLNFKPASPDSGTCLGAKADSCTKYGRMYDWKTAMAGAVASRYLPRAVQGLCPAGWHLPTQGEWEELANSVGTDPKHTRNLKSVSGWPPLANGSDAHGFRALPAGMVVGLPAG
ncbi:MAG: hypothetical protein H6686_04945 [Fibrobacteria bacterium]|nr:hypothetical protein [Fibrobacteria bacterium]